MQRFYKKWILITLLVLSAWWVFRLVWGRPLQINHFYLRAFAEYLKEDPELLSNLGFLDHTLLDFHSGKLTDVSPDQQQRIVELFKKNRTILASYPADSFTPEEKLSYEVFKWYLDDRINQAAFRWHDYPINQHEGIQKELVRFMVSDHPVVDQRSAENYIRRLRKFDVKFNQLLEGVRLREQKGVIAPRFVLVKVLAEINAFTAVPAAQNILFTSFCEKLRKADRIDTDQKTGLEKKVLEEIRTTVYGAYQRLAQELEPLALKANDDAGVWKLPDGDAYFAQRLRSYTTTDLTPQQVHELGLREVARLQEEMRRSASKLGFPGLSGLEAVEKLKMEQRFSYTDSEAGRRQALTDFQGFIDETGPRVASLFEIPLKNEVRVRGQVRELEGTSPLVIYRHPAPETGRPAFLELNLRNMAEIKKYNLCTLAWHEALPGHHYQHEIQRGLKNLPMFRRFLHFSAYSEGWAMYAEQLTWEQGGLGEEYNLGRLQSELWRAVRLVTDTGIHYKRWTREQAIDYMVRNTGLHRDSVATEVERYIVDPGQACAYTIGLIKIRELREKAQEALGPRFDLRSFHHIVLGNGALPLDILEKRVEQYIGSR